ncbi:MAG TPA: plastocyanin/azurin family copper-binding protein [Vicinamibacterales bacterium]|nr:plastocyanin/azurin family copper-binding protein [Vicinamibacterales bacterium]
MHTRMRLMLLAMLLMSAAACGSNKSPNSPTPTTANAAITGSGFTPATIDISVGSTVVWTNNDTVPHSVVADGGQFNSGTIGPGAKYSYAFPAAGNFPYHDAANPRMTGMVNVSGNTSPGY